MKFGQLVIRKIIKIIATRCHILRLNSPNSIPAAYPAGGAYSVLPHSLVGIKGP